MQVDGAIAETYEDFAAYAAGSSPCFEAWARGVAHDPEVQAWLAELPQPKRQPNLVFAAARWHGLHAPAPYADLRSSLLDDDGSIRGTILDRATQTNEVGRLATLVPAFAVLAGGRRISLLEVGSSAGLCLYPDRWSYRWQTETGLVAAGGAGPVLSATVTGAAPLPDRPPAVTRRVGIDINPLDVHDTDAMAWLAVLVWPEHGDRLGRLQQAIEIAKADPARIISADLLDALPTAVEETLREMASDDVLVVFHSAVVAYLDESDRERFDRLMRELIEDPRVHWVSNEGRRVLPGVTATRPEPPPGRFVLGIDGRSVGHTEGHGRSFHWYDDPVDPPVT